MNFIITRSSTAFLWRAIILASVLACLLSRSARGESMIQQAEAFAGGLGNVVTTPGGAAQMPQYVYQAASTGQMPTAYMFILGENQMLQCGKQAALRYFSQRTPYPQAKQIFDQGMCEIKQCLMQTLVTQMLTTLSTNTTGGGSSDTSAASQSLQSLAQSLAAPGQSCDGGQTASFDPYLLSFIQNFQPGH